jgi:hypothetical protein
VIWVEQHPEIMESFLTQLRERQAYVQIPLMLPFVCSLVYLEYRIGIMRTRAQEIQEVEKKTHFNTFHKRSKAPPHKIDHYGLSTWMAGTKAELMVAKHRLYEFTKILEFLDVGIKILIKPSINTDGRSLRALIEMQTCL